MSTSPGEVDAIELRTKLDAAIAAIPEVRYANGYPVYPPAFRDFTNFISRSPWHRTDYVEDMKSNLRERIDTLTYDEIRSFLTMMIRIDRFSPGGLLSLLEDGTAARVVGRAEKLTA